MAGVGHGGIYEGRTFEQLLYNAGWVNDRYFPVVFSEIDGRYIPLDLQGYSHFPVYTQSG